MHPLTTPKPTDMSSRGWRHAARAAAMLALAAAMFSDAGAAATGTDPPRYRFQALPPLAGATFGLGVAVNDRGQVAGFGGGPEYDHAVRWDGSHPVDLNPAWGVISQATAINGAGQVVGWSHGATTRTVTRAYRWDGTTPHVLRSLGGHISFANAINDAGLVVGESRLAGDEVTRATLWHGSQPTDLGTLGGRDSGARDIDAHGRIVGYSQLAGRRVAHATLWAEGVPIDLGALFGPRTSSLATAINDRGVIVGVSERRNGESHAFVWRNGRMIDLGPGTASDINSHGQIVGERDGHAWMWQGRSGFDLNASLDPAVVAAGWRLVQANGINDRGWITGLAFNDENGRARAYLLRPAPVPELLRPSPVPEPQSWALAAAGLGVVVLAARRRARRSVP